MDLKQKYLDLYQYTAKTDRLQALVDYTYAHFGRAILIADSIHNIMAVSPDVQAAAGDHMEWHDLVEDGWLPAPPSADDPFRKPLEIQIEQPPAIHLTRCSMQDGTAAYMCDLRNQDHIVLKVAVMRTDGTKEDEAFANTFSECCCLLYYRLIVTGSASLSGRGQYLQELIYGGTPSEQVTAQWLGIQPPYRIMVFPKSSGGVVDLSFSAMVSAITRAAGFIIRTVSREEQLVLLLHSPESSDSLAEIDAFLRQYRQPAGLSAPFSIMDEAASAFHQALDNLSAALDFTGFCRCARQEEFGPFLMFRRIAESSDPMLHPDATALDRMDEKQSLHDLETVFVWLYFGKNAAEASRHIYVHRNTLDNRMRRITDLSGAAWENGGYCTRMLYSAWYLLRKRRALRDNLLFLPKTEKRK